MATNTYSYNGTASSLAGGVAAVAGQGNRYRVTFGGTWAQGNGYQFSLVTAAQTITLGQGRVTGTVPSSAITLYGRVQFVAGSYWYGSDNADSTGWELQAPGAFKILVTNQSQQAETLLALSAYQGRVALFSRLTAQIWSIDADPTNITQNQVLSTAGTVSAFGVQGIGDFDVFFVNNSGVRSLRARETTLNAFVTDIGSAIDSLVQAAVAGQTQTQLNGIVSIVEPSVNRVMIYFPSTGVWYVLSYFPATKIIAWSSYTSSVHALGTFTSVGQPKIYNSIVFFRGTISGTNYVFSYGTPDGTSTNMYDDTVPIVTMPWLDLKAPGKRKKARGVDVIGKGQWSIYGSMDFNGVNGGASLKTIASQLNAGSNNDFATSQKDMLAWSDDGYHVQLQAKGDSTAYPGALKKLSELVFYYLEAGEK